MTAKRLILLILLIGILLITPISAKELTTVVDDKEIVATHGTSFTIHTVDFGDILVTPNEYEKIFINDTVTFKTKSNIIGYWEILKINGVIINE